MIHTSAMPASTGWTTIYPLRRGGRGMLNGYTKEEICMLYRDAKDQNKQIDILSQLTGLRTFEIERILEEGGYLVGAKKNTEIREKIKELHAQGLTTAEIAKEIKTVYSNAYRYQKQMGLNPNIREDAKMEKDADYNVVEKLKEETKTNLEELKEVLPRIVVSSDSLPINYELQEGKAIDIVETLTPQQYYELAKITLQLLKMIWEG